MKKPKGINIKKLTDKDIGRSVVYKSAPQYISEPGWITSYNSKNIFVAFGSRTMGRGESCDPSDLEF